MRVNKTENNLQRVWDNLDNACGSLDNAFTDLGLMVGLPESLKKSVDMIDFSAIICLRNDIEELLEKLKEEI